MIKQFFRDRLQIAHRNIEFDWRKLKEFGITPTVILLLGTIVSIAVSLAAIYGTFTIVTGDNPIPSATESTGLALLSAALAAVILLLVKSQPKSTGDKQSGDVTSRRSQTAELIGNSFIIAAMAFALFGLLCPFLGAVSQGQRFFPYTTFGDFSEMCVKCVAFASLMIGTVTLVMPLSFGPFLLISDMMRKKK